MVQSWTVEFHQSFSDSPIRAAPQVALLGGPVRATPLASSVTEGGNRTTRRKPAVLATINLDNILLTCDQGNFDQIAAQSRTEWREAQALPLGN